MNYIVTGILKDLPANTRFSFDFLVNWTIDKEAECLMITTGIIIPSIHLYT